MESTINVEDLKFRIDGLPDFIFKKVDKVVTEYEKERDEEEFTPFSVCPKCGKEHPHLIKGGSNALNQMKAGRNWITPEALQIMGEAAADLGSRYFQEAGWYNQPAGARPFFLGSLAFNVHYCVFSDGFRPKIPCFRE